MYFVTMFFLQPQVEFIKYQENGDNFIAFHLLDSSKMLLCTANELSIVGISSPSSSVDEDAPSEFMVHRRARSEDENRFQMLSSFFGSASVDSKSEPAYCCTAWHEPVASRTMIGCADDGGHLELYLLSGSSGDCGSVAYQVHDRKSVPLPFVPPRDSKSEPGLTLLISGYAPRDGVCWFSVLLFYAVNKKGGGAVLQCAYRKSTDTLELHGQFEPLHGIPAQNVHRLDAAIYDRLLWCGVVSSSGGGGGNDDADDYDVFFCDIGHYLDKYHRHGAGSSSATKWKFQRMWKRSEYISRILKGIELECSFECFYQQFAASLDRLECASSRDLEACKHRVHDLILHFWTIRLVDDPSLELDAAILEAELSRIAAAHSLGHSEQSRWDR